MLYIPTSDGIMLAVQDLNQRGSKTVLLVHGWPLSQRMWDYTIPALLEQDCRVVTYDLAGFGDSDAPASGYNYDNMAADLFDLIRYLHLERIALVGFSMGGAISVRYMAKYAQGVDRLVLLDAAVPSYCKTRRNPYGQPVEDTDKLIELGWNDRPQLNKTFGDMFFAGEHSKPYLDLVQRISDKASMMGEMGALIALRDEDCFNDLQDLYWPTLIIHGKDDKICSFAMAQLTQKQIEGAELVGIEKAGHGAFYDQMEQVNQELINFIGGENG